MNENAHTVHGSAARPWLECLAAQERYRIAPMFVGCPQCVARGKPSALEVRYDYDRLREFEPGSASDGIWRWQDLLPAIDPQNRISLGEGSTPLLKLKQWNGAAALYLKNETAN